MSRSRSDARRVTARAENRAKDGNRRRARALRRRARRLPQRRTGRGERRAGRVRAALAGGDASRFVFLRGGRVRELGGERRVDAVGGEYRRRESNERNGSSASIFVRRRLLDRREREREWCELATASSSASRRIAARVRIGARDEKSRREVEAQFRNLRRRRARRRHDGEKQRRAARAGRAEVGNHAAVRLCQRRASRVAVRAEYADEGDIRALRRHDRGGKIF